MHLFCGAYGKPFIDDSVQVLLMQFITDDNEAGFAGFAFFPFTVEVVFETAGYAL
jgi:hypothetical protein